jgi:sugar-specific transcriptional regulator TrmB
MIHESLKKLGFSEKEIAVYLSLLSLGASPASTLARVTQLKRPTVYLILNGLLERNLIVSYKQGKYTYFAIDDPKKLYFNEREKTDIAQQLVETLKAQIPKASQWDIHYYKGQGGYNELYEGILKDQPKEICAWLNVEEFIKGLDPLYEKKWTRERVKRKIFTRMILPDTPFTKDFRKKDANSQRETRLMPKGRQFESSCVMYDDRIIFFSPGEETVGLKIQHAGLYQMHKQIFELSWETLG